MPKKAFDSLSEPMFYVLMALKRSNMCGTDIADWIKCRSSSRVQLGPGTLYTILSHLNQEKAIEEIMTVGRKRIYCITPHGIELFDNECNRLRACLNDLEEE